MQLGRITAEYLVFEIVSAECVEGDEDGLPAKGSGAFPRAAISPFAGW
jgi:hypothetical protein